MAAGSTEVEASTSVLSGLLVPEIAITMLNGNKERIQPQEFTAKSTEIEASSNMLSKLQVPEIVLPMLESNKDRIEPRKFPSGFKETEVSSNMLSNLQVPEIVLQMLKINKVSALLIDALVFSKIDRIQPQNPTAGDTSNRDAEEIEASSNVFPELKVVLPMLEHFNKDRVQLQTFSSQITETTEAFPKVLASKLQLPQIFLPKLQISKGLNDCAIKPHAEPVGKAFLNKLKRKFERNNIRGKLTKRKKGKKVFQTKVSNNKSTLQKGHKSSKRDRNNIRGKLTKRRKGKKVCQTKATTTGLVGEIFQEFFQNQLEGDIDRTKQQSNQRCLKMAVQDEDDVEFETTLKWTSEPFKLDEDRKYYTSVLVNNEKVNLGDYVRLCPSDPEVQTYICKVISMWQNNQGEKLFHGRWLSHCWDTIIGKTGDPMELFLVDLCDNNPLGSIVGKCAVKYKAPDCINSENIDDEHDGEYYYQMWYDDDHARFEQQVEYFEADNNEDECISCLRQRRKEEFDKPMIGEPLTHDSGPGPSNELFRTFSLRGVQYTIGDTLYLTPDAFNFSVTPAESKPVVKKLDPKDNSYQLEKQQKKVLSKLLSENFTEAIIDVQTVVGKCKVLCLSESEILNHAETLKSPDTFYFTKVYNSQTLKFENVPKGGFETSNQA
ncbi:DNA (cytosine-5)-methyltransferase 1, partial [Paramuricea clavata]